MSSGTVENLKTVSAALAHDDPKTGDAIILVIHQAIHIPSLKNNLLCPMQLRMNDVQVSETPKFLADNPEDSTHALVIPDPDSDEPHVMPFSLDGVTSCFPTRKPMAQEFEMQP